MDPPEGIARAVRWLVGIPAAMFAITALFAAVVMPYRLWDSLAFGAWSRSIAEGSGLWADAPSLFLQRPLFYIAQGLVWKVADDEWLGRLLSLSFVAILVVAVWILARRLADSREAQAFLPPLSAGVVLGSSVLATYSSSGMSDVPVAAMVAATGAALWVARPGVIGITLVTVLAAGAVLAKPTGLLGLAGLVAAAIVFRGRGAIRGVAGVALGAGVALAYDAWQAARIDDRFTDFLTAGNDEFWRERGTAARWDALARAEWLGGGLRLLVLFGLVHAIARVAGARPRTALSVAAVVALTWSVAGPVIADGGAPHPLDGSIVGLIGWLIAATAMAVAPFVAQHDPLSRRAHGALLVWLAPTFLAWAWQRADETRHLAPAWAPLALLAAGGMAALSVALLRLRPLASLAPAAAVGVLLIANVIHVDGLGREGWSDLLDLGSSGWSNRAEMENFAYGPFSYELNLARENVGEDDRIVSSNGRLTYFFPGQVEFRYARSCSELEGARFFSYLTAGESLEFATREGQPTDPLGWIQCTLPTLTLVGEQPGIYAAFVVGNPPDRAPAAEDCRITTTGGQLVDAVFGEDLPYQKASALRDRAEAVGFQGVRIERTGCSAFRVVVTGVPTEASVQAELRREVESVGLRVEYAEAVRYPEVSSDIPAVR